MSKILSILVPVYNTEKYIRRCLDSILISDVLSSIEVIIVSDGSKDKSIDIIKSEYLPKYKDTIVLVEKENGGHGSTINKGIEIASGKYFRVLDSDDWFNIDSFKLFVDRLKSTDADLVVCNYRQEHIYDNSSKYYEYCDLEENKLYDFDSFDLNILHGEYFVMATSTYKTSIIKNSVSLLEKTFYVDMQYNVQCILPVKTFIYYNLDIYRYYIGRKDQSTNLNGYVKNKLHHEKVMKYLIDLYTNKVGTLSSNKNKYIKEIIVYMLFTNYNIFCSYDHNYKEAYIKIKDFDSYLYKTNSDLYLRMNEFSYIKAHRITKFKFVKTKMKICKKMYNIIYKVIGR